MKREAPFLNDFILIYLDIVCITSDIIFLGFPLKKGKIIKTIPVLQKEWKVSFDLKVFGSRNSWGSIVHFTVNGNHGMGNRIPAVWTRPGSTGLHIISAIDDNGNSAYNTDDLEKKQFYSVVIEQKKRIDDAYEYNIWIDD